MKNKFYTPSVEEFYVGFRFEMFFPCEDSSKVLSDYDLKWRKENNIPSYRESHWGKMITDLDILSWFKGWFERHQFRVKYLDKADIEELGWNIDEWKQTKKSGEVRIRLHPMFEHNHLLTIERKDYYRDGSGNYTIIPLLSRAVVKNYNELKKIMEMLNIK